MMTINTRRLTLATVFTATITAVFVVQPGSRAAHAASVYEWQMRPLFVFANAPGDARLIAQQKLLEGQREGLIDRDMAVILIIADTIRTTLGPGPDRTARQLRQRFGVSPGDFTAILVGKDGGAKLRSKTPVTTDRLFALIDSMPMRRQEMRQR